MTSTVYLDGRYLPRDEATVSVDDRGWLFGDGVYEVVRYYNGRPMAIDRHVERLRASLEAISLDLPPDLPGFDAIDQQLLQANGMADAASYWQVTRGPAPRQHHFPDPPVRPTVYATLNPQPPFDPDAEVARFKAVTGADQRWTRSAVKSISLLANVLARQAAAEAGCDEAILVRDGVVTEGTLTSILIVSQGTVIAHPLDGTILGSVTRQIVLELARDLNIPVAEQPWPADRLAEADEIMSLGTTVEVSAVVSVDDCPVADGQPGPITRRLLDAYRELIRQACGV